MHVRIRCRNDACRARFTAPLTPESPDSTAAQDSASVPVCPVCRQEHTWHAGAFQDSRPVACPVCGGDELYVRKDFPQRAGLALVVIVALIAFWLLARGDLLWALGLLAGVAILDLFVYLAVPKLTVCYRCRAEVCAAAINPEHEGFDLATAEKYR